MSQYNHPTPTSFLLDEEKRQLILMGSVTLGLSLRLVRR